ncbi:MAG: HAD-IC family P-type ATPase, partial [Proteobacteria bacterium]|nr:HAD-IC family P-type ATPase [Pseudomonadota bacterium]
MTNPVSEATVQGLTTPAARERQIRYGPNLPTRAGTRGGWRALRHLWAPVPWMLELAIILQVALHEYAEAAVIGFLLLFNALLSWTQERRADATLEALKARLALVAAVRRDGRWTTVAASELVPGDLVRLTLGSIVAADVRLLDGGVLLDQSALTGESLPVEAAAGATAYAGSLVRRGQALAEVTATGTRTKFGQAAQLVAIARAPSTRQRAVLQVVRRLAGVSAIIVAVQLVYATASAMTPAETLPLVLTAVLAAVPVAL